MNNSIPTNDVRIMLGLLTEDEFGRAVGVVGPTVALWRGKGEGPPYYRFKRNIFYRTADVTQWIIENTWDPVSGELLVPPPPRPPRPKTRLTRGDGTLSLSADDIAPQNPATSTPPPGSPAYEPEDRVPSAVSLE
jgi:hypothetical protein